MKAIVYTRYGSPDVLQRTEVEKPTPRNDEVLVRVHAVSANALDWHHLRGAPFLVRLQDGLRKPKNSILGSDIAGRVVGVGPSVTQFQPGDEVFGGIGQGGFAEYVAVRETRLLLKPANISFEAAAAVPVAAITALQGLRDSGQLQPGQKVLINGASGGVGTFAVQLAKSFGAEVTGVCSTRNLDMVRGIGADHIIDYTQEDFTSNGQHYDLIVDIAANHSVSACTRALSPWGIWVIVGFSTMFHLVRFMLLGSWVSRTGSQHIGLLQAKLNPTDLALLKELLEAGKVVPVIDRCYPLSAAAEAIRYLEEGHARGKVIITVEQNDQ